MKQQAAVAVGVIALTGLSGLAYAARAREAGVQDKPKAATPAGAPARASFSRAEREAIIEGALAAAQKSNQIDERERDGNNIPRRLWGRAIERLRPLRVVNDDMNVMIVLTEDGRGEAGLYVDSIISSVYNTRVTLEPLSQPGDKLLLGGLSRYRIRKK